MNTHIQSSERAVNVQYNKRAVQRQVDKPCMPDYVNEEARSAGESEEHRSQRIDIACRMVSKLQAKSPSKSGYRGVDAQRARGGSSGGLVKSKGLCAIVTFRWASLTCPLTCCKSEVVKLAVSAASAERSPATAGKAPSGTDLVSMLTPLLLRDRFAWY